MGFNTGTLGCVLLKAATLLHNNMSSNDHCMWMTWFATKRCLFIFTLSKLCYFKIWSLILSYSYLKCFYIVVFYFIHTHCFVVLCLFCPAIHISIPVYPLQCCGGVEGYLSSEEGHTLNRSITRLTHTVQLLPFTVTVNNVGGLYHLTCFLDSVWKLKHENRHTERP